MMAITMKQYTILSFFIFMLVTMIVFPNESFIGAQHGLLLWFQTILPTLLPFVILSNFLIQSNAVYYIAKLIHPIFKRIFHVTEYGSYAVFTGFYVDIQWGQKLLLI